MKWLGAPAALLLVLGATSSWAQREDSPGLRNNPFSRPALAQPKPAPKKAVPVAKQKPVKQQERPREPEKPPEPPWEPELRGTLVAGPRSVANVGGVVLAIGEEVDGHQLLEVREAEAIFQKGGKMTLVTMDGETVPLPDLGALPGSRPVQLAAERATKRAGSSPFAHALGRIISGIVDPAKAGRK